DSSGHVPMTSITSSSPDVVSARLFGVDAVADPLAAGTAVLTAETDNAECGTSTLRVTVQVTEAPTVSDTTTSVDANSTNNPVTLDIDGYEIDSVAVASQPANGIATASDTTITYTPDARFWGNDSF